MDKKRMKSRLVKKEQTVTTEPELVEEVIEQYDPLTGERIDDRVIAYNKDSVTQMRDAAQDEVDRYNAILAKFED